MSPDQFEALAEWVRWEVKIAGAIGTGITGAALRNGKNIRDEAKENARKALVK
jgi:hypothetical protein